MINNEKKLFAITIFCAVLGLLFRLFYFLRYPVQTRDAYFYQVLIEQWETNGEIVDRISFFPLSIWIMKIPYHLFHYDIIKGGILINILLGILLIIVAIKILSRLFKNNYVVFIAGCILATHPALVRFSCSLLRENSYLLFSLLAFSALLKYCIKKDLLNLVAVGIFGALAFLCRLEGIEFLAIVCLALLFLLVFRRIKFSKAVLHSSVFLIVFLLTVVILFFGLKFKMIGKEEIMSKIDEESMMI